MRARRRRRGGRRLWRRRETQISRRFLLSVPFCCCSFSFRFGSFFFFLVSIPSGRAKPQRRSTAVEDPNEPTKKRPNKRHTNNVEWRKRKRKRNEKKQTNNNEKRKEEEDWKTHPLLNKKLRNAKEINNEKDVMDRVGVVGGVVSLRCTPSSVWNHKWRPFFVHFETPLHQWPKATPSPYCCCCWCCSGWWQRGHAPPAGSGSTQTSHFCGRERATHKKKSLHCENQPNPTPTTATATTTTTARNWPTLHPRSEMEHHRREVRVEE